MLHVLIRLSSVRWWGSTEDKSAIHVWKIQTLNNQTTLICFSQIFPSHFSSVNQLALQAKWQEELTEPDSAVSAFKASSATL